MKSVIQYLKSTKLVRKQAYNNLTVFPLISPDGLNPYYLTLEQAIEEGCIEITEVDESGNVNDLFLKVTGRKPVLLIEGEELKGAKQNRLINASFLIAGGTSTKIPVSCVEEGRWSYSSRQFSSGKKMMHASLRREAQSTVKSSLERGSGHRSDQGRIWNNIAETSMRMKVASPTMAIADVFDKNQDRLEDYTERFEVVENQVGALFAIDGKVVGLECFGSRETFKQFFKKLVQSYAMDALDRSETVRKIPPPPPARARSFVESAVKSTGKRHKAVSLGETISFESRIVSGAALADTSKVLHLSAFRKNGSDSSAKVGFQRFSYRRRGRH
jgi:hypothetical protein